MNMQVRMRMRPTCEKDPRPSNRLEPQSLFPHSEARGLPSRPGGGERAKLRMRYLRGDHSSTRWFAKLVSDKRTVLANEFQIELQ